MRQAHVFIMAGGIGSRFWPASRSHCPKQFLDVLGLGKTLLQMTYERFLPLVPPERIWVVTHRDYVDLVRRQLPDLPPENLLAEPSRNNTAPCIAYAALCLRRRFGPEALMIVAPSDHLILKQAAFLEHLRRALDFAAEQPALLTLGIAPHRPDTGYGYIQYRADAPAGDAPRPVLRFVEKPDLARAQAFLEQGGYLWNAGIFVWKTARILQALEAYAPDILHRLQAGEPLFGTPRGEDFLAEQYPQTPNVSIDVAVMERAEGVYTLPVDIGWSDLGTWASLYEHLPQDEQGNAVPTACQPRVFALDSSGCLLRCATDKTLIVKDLKDYIVVDEKDVLLIYPKNKEQEIKNLEKLINKL